MTSLNISLPDSLKAFAEEQAAVGGYTSVSEYFRELLRADQKRKAEAKLEALLLEGINSGEPIPVTPQFWEDLRNSLREHIAKKSGGMKQRLSVLPRARQDLLQHAAFISKDNPGAGEWLYEAADATFQQLVEMPEMGATRQYGGSALDGLRMFPIRDFPKYLVFYRPTRDGVQVIRVLHAARDIASIFGLDPE